MLGRVNIPSQLFSGFSLYKGVLYGKGCMGGKMLLFNSLIWIDVYSIINFVGILSLSNSLFTISIIHLALNIVSFSLPLK